MRLELERIRRDFEERMDDDLDTAGALGVVHTFAQEGNRALDQGLGGEHARAALGQLDRFDVVFGVLGAGPAEEAPPEVQDLARRRLEARKGRDFKASDVLRDEIKAKGWSVEDTKDGYKLRRL